MGQCTFEHYFPYYPAPKNKALLLSDGGYLSYSAAWKDTFYFGLKESDLVLVKTDSCGNVLWVNDTGYAADGDPDKYAVEMDSGNIMIVGYTAAGLPGSMGNIRVGKYNKNGQLIKEKLIQGGPISAPNGLIKNKTKSDSYFIYGYTDNIGTGKAKPLLVEIDSDLSMKKWKELYHPRISKANYSVGSLINFIQLNDTTHAAVVSAGTLSIDTNFMCHLDTNFNVTQVYSILNDTIYHLGLYSMMLNEDQQLIDCAAVYKRTKSHLSRDCVLKMDFEGNIQKIVYFSDTIYNIACMSPTQDDGYIIISTQLVKIDSNFTVEWVKSIRGWGLLSVEELPGGGYIAAGISDLHTQSLGYEPGYNEMYLVKMDKDGNYIHTGVKDPDPSASRQIVVYPNPTNTTLTIQSKQPYSSIELYNTTGNLVLKETNTPETMSVSALPQGLYILRILGPQQEVVATVKVSVVH